MPCDHKSFRSSVVLSAAAAAIVGVIYPPLGLWTLHLAGGLLGCLAIALTIKAISSMLMLTSFTIEDVVSSLRPFRRRDRIIEPLEPASPKAPADVGSHPIYL